MTNFPSAGGPERLHFSHAERREIIVKHESLIYLTLEGFQFLLIFSRSKSCHSESLGFSSDKERRAMSTRKDSHMARYSPYLVGFPAICPCALHKYLTPDDLLFVTLENISYIPCQILIWDSKK